MTGAGVRWRMLVCVFVQGEFTWLEGEAYVRLRAVLREATFAPPRALQKLAAITDFDLFVTTTFDSMPVARERIAQGTSIARVPAVGMTVVTAAKMSAAGCHPRYFGGRHSSRVVLPSSTFPSRVSANE